MKPNDLARWEGYAQRSDDGCWEWLGSVNQQGYARMCIQGKYKQAHRLGYEHFVGPIPAGLVLDHLCRNRACVNPHHLEPVTAAENTLRGQGACAANARKTHCPHGHEYKPANTVIVNGSVGRRCLTCYPAKAAS